MDKELARRGENLAGVIKAVVRDVMFEREGRNRDLIKKIAAEEFGKMRSEIEYPTLTEWPKNNTGQSWTDKEDIQLGEEWGRLVSIIARKHQRTFGSIKARIAEKIYHLPRL